MAPQDFAVVLVHGFWHDPKHWDNVTQKLVSAGYEVQTPALRSSSDVVVADCLAADVAIIRQAIEHFTHAGKDVVVVLHSYSGVVGSEAIAEISESANNTQPQASKHGRIRHIFYACAIIVEKGFDILTTMRSLGMQPHEADMTNGLSYHLSPYHRFYQLTATDKARRSIGLMHPAIINTHLSPTKYCGWADYDLPVTYLLGKYDNAFQPDPSKFPKRLEAANIRDLTVKTLESDHTPWLSKEDEFMAVLDDVLERASKHS